MRTTLKITQIVDEWIASLDIMSATRRDYKRRLEMWFRWLSSRKIEPRTPRRVNVLAYKQYLIDEKYSVSTINAMICVVRLFYGWCEDRRYWENIAAGVKSIKSYGDYSKYPLSAEQATKLIESLKEDVAIELRDKLMSGLMLFNGLRTCEVARINIDDFTTMDGEPVLRIQRKGRHEKGEIIVLHQDMVGWVDRYLAGKKSLGSGGAPLFVSHRPPDATRLTRQSISHIIKQRMRDVGIDEAKLTPHSLRHTYGTMLVESGVDIETVRDLMGHSSSQTTRIYVGMAQKKRLLRHPPSRIIYDKIIKNSDENKQGTL